MEHLLDPIVFKAVQVAQRGDIRHPGSTSSLQIEWSGDSLEQLTEWLKGGAQVEPLAHLLAEHPTLIGHPLVYRQVAHLKWLRRVPDEADMAEGFASPYDYCPPAGTRQAAQKGFRALVEAWVQGMVGKAWALKPPPGTRGRKRTLEDIDLDFQLLLDYDDVLTQLRRTPVRPGKGESKEDWAARLCDIVRRAWDESGLDKEYHSEPLPPGALPEEVLTMRIETRKLPLPEAEVRAWVEEACELASEGPIRDRLAYALVGYRCGLRPDQVRGRIQTARRS